MHKISRLLIMASLAMLAVMLATGNAAANRRLEARGLEAGRAITVRNNGTVTFGGGFGSILCRRATLRGVVVRASVDKTAAGRSPEGQIGELTEGTASECTGPFGETVSTVILLEPRTNGLRHSADIRYDGFFGTLPNINGHGLSIGKSTTWSINFQRVLGSLSCQYRQETEARIEFPARAEGNAGEFRRNRSALIRELSSEGCPTEGELRGRGIVTPPTSVALL